MLRILGKCCSVYLHSACYYDQQATVSYCCMGLSHHFIRALASNRLTLYLQQIICMYMYSPIYSASVECRLRKHIHRVKVAGLLQANSHTLPSTAGPASTLEEVSVRCSHHAANVICLLLWAQYPGSASVQTSTQTPWRSVPWGQWGILLRRHKLLAAPLHYSPLQ